MATTETTARRLALLAGVVRDRAYHPQARYIDQLAELLEAAAATAPVLPCEDGRRLPADTLNTLQEAVDLMTGHDFHIPAVMIEYATAPALGGLPDMKPLNAVSEPLARQDFDIQARRNTVLHGRHLDSSDDEIAAWALRSLVVLHYKHERLAASVAIDNDRPCNRGKAPFAGRHPRA